MQKNVAETLYAACEKALVSLTDAERAIFEVADEDERKQLLCALSELITGVLMNIRFPVVRQYPELVPPPELGQPDTDLSEEEQAIVSKLGQADILRIDEALLAECAVSWKRWLALLEVQWARYKINFQVSQMLTTRSESLHWLALAA